MTKRPEGEWPFVVRASSDAENITLRWEGNRYLLRNAVLHDKQTHKKIRIHPGQVYTFKNFGGENHFSFIIEQDKGTRQYVD